MSYFVIIRGPLGSGKTTIARKLATRLNASYISIDIILKKYGLDQVSPDAACIPVKNFLKANEIVLPEAKETLRNGRIVIFDACFYHKKQIGHLIKNLPFPHYVFTLKVPLSICIERDKKRNKTLGKDAASAVHKLVSRFDYGKVIDASTGNINAVVREILSHLPKTTNHANRK